MRLRDPNKSSQHLEHWGYKRNVISKVARPAIPDLRGLGWPIKSVNARAFSPPKKPIDLASPLQATQRSTIDQDSTAQNENGKNCAIQAWLKETMSRIFQESGHCLSQSFQREQLASARRVALGTRPLPHRAVFDMTRWECIETIMRNGQVWLTESLVRQNVKRPPKRVAFRRFCCVATSHSLPRTLSYSKAKVKGATSYPI